jgi:hypothetical protein
MVFLKMRPSFVEFHSPYKSVLSSLIRLAGANFEKHSIIKVSKKWTI